MEKKIPTKQILQLQHTEVIRATSSVFFQFFIISSKVLWGRKDYALMPLKACGLCAASPWSCGKSRERKQPTWSICSNFKSYIILWPGLHLVMTTSDQSIMLGSTYPNNWNNQAFTQIAFLEKKNTSCTSLTLAYIVLTLGPKAKTGSLAISCC